MKKLNKKGFTLAELLIVVAIIAVLVAIAIPIFTTQLEKSRETTDIANLRAAYAAATVAGLNGKLATGSGIVNGTTYYYNPNVDGSLDTKGITIGQGTATDGQADVAGLTSGIIVYKNKDNVKDQKIACKFQSGVLSSVKFGT